MFVSARTVFFTALTFIIFNNIFGVVGKIDDVETQKKIVIIGAGASGIAAASKLLANGYENIVILEAEDRIGGRVWTVNDGDKFLEMGAQWIMGEDENVLYNLANGNSVLQKKIEDFNGIYVKSNGDLIPSEVIEPYFKAYNDILEKNHDNNQKISEIFENYIEQIDSDDKQTIKLFFKNLIETLTPVTNWNQESGAGISTFETIPGSSAISLKTGVNALLYMIMNTYPNTDLTSKWKDLIHFNAKVKHINWNQEKPFVQYTLGGNPTGLHNIEADYIIVTIPLGVLKHSYDELFVHPLPEKKISAIKNLSYGVVNKVFLTFEEQWWPNNTLLYTFFTEDDLKNLDISDKWLSNIAGFFPEENYPATLTAWFVEKDDITSEIHLDTEIYTKLTKFIKNVFGKQGWTVTDPIKTRRTKWQQASNFRGSYSYRGLNASKNGITNADLREPLFNQDGKMTVLFAGEATHDKYYSTLHGAVETGYLAADTIIKANNID
uniref:CSON006941 protein n=1 Tax=Culicoides sonorensis TaxID=179676 RepID=A0A336N5J9_CULSO